MKYFFIIFLVLFYLLSKKESFYTTGGYTDSETETDILMELDEHMSEYIENEKIEGNTELSDYNLKNTAKTFLNKKYEISKEDIDNIINKWIKKSN